MTRINVQRKFLLGLVALALVTPACGGDTSADESEVMPLTSNATITVEACTEKGGKFIGDPGDGRTHRDGCPTGQELLGSVEFGIEGGICCK